MEKQFDVTLYSRRDVEKAKRRGQVAGWLQGAGVVLAGVLLLKFLGWIPVLLLVAGVGFLAMKLANLGDDAEE